jgi:chromatin remodeling complex protein RSC6
MSKRFWRYIREKEKKKRGEKVRRTTFHPHPSNTIIHTYLAKCDSMLEKVIHRISEFYLKNVQIPRMIADQRI